MHFYPRFYATEFGLERQEPPIHTLSEFRAALADPGAWANVLSFLEQHDPFYDRLSFRADPLDHSVLGRLVRRAWAQSAHRRRLSDYYEPTVGFTDHEDTITVTRAIIESFAAQARADGQLPVILLFNDQGFSDHLYRAVHERMDELDIPYISSHEVVRAEEAANFLPDGHFRPQFDRELAVRLASLIEEHRVERGERVSRWGRADE